jgi:hypothetical protein
VTRFAVEIDCLRLLNHAEWVGATGNHRTLGLEAVTALVIAFVNVSGGNCQEPRITLTLEHSRRDSAPFHVSDRVLQP